MPPSTPRIAVRVELRDCSFVTVNYNRGLGRRLSRKRFYQCNRCSFEVNGSRVCWKGLLFRKYRRTEARWEIAATGVRNNAESCSDRECMTMGSRLQWQNSWIHANSLNSRAGIIICYGVLRANIQIRLWILLQRSIGVWLAWRRYAHELSRRNICTSSLHILWAEQKIERGTFFRLSQVKIMKLMTIELNSQQLIYTAFPTIVYVHTALEYGITAKLGRRRILLMLHR